VFYTYAHYTPQGRLFYIGKGTKSRAHKFSKRNNYWKKVVAKHGNPIVQILADWKTSNEACEHEIFLIKCFKDLGYELCNMTDGGEGSLGVTPWNKGLQWSEEIKNKQGAANIGNTHWLGKKHSEQSKAKASATKCKFKYIGTHKETGNTVELIGKKAITNAGFVPQWVYYCAIGKTKAHKGYTWVKEPLGSI